MLIISSVNSDWGWWVYSEYRAMEREFAPQREQFLTRLTTILGNDKYEPRSILLKEMTPFTWDQVCVFGGYSRLQTGMEKVTGQPFPALARYKNKEWQWAGVFLRDGQLVSVLRFNYDDVYVYPILTPCSDSLTAAFKPVDFNAEIKTDRQYRVVNAKELKFCSARTPEQCKFIFMEYENGNSRPRRN